MLKFAQVLFHIDKMQGMTTEQIWLTCGDYKVSGNVETVCWTRSMLRANQNQVQISVETSQVGHSKGDREKGIWLYSIHVRKRNRFVLFWSCFNGQLIWSRIKENNYIRKIAAEFFIAYRLERAKRQPNITIRDKYHEDIGYCDSMRNWPINAPEVQGIQCWTEILRVSLEMGWCDGYSIV